MGRRYQANAGRSMIRNSKKLREYEDAYIRSRPADHEQSLRIVNALYEHAKFLGVIDKTRSFGDLESKIRLARVLNV